jgi:hypothetical protein
VLEHPCPECGEEFLAMWQVAVEAQADRYTPVFGGPIVLDYGRCDRCHTDYERTDKGPWRRQGSG